MSVDTAYGTWHKKPKGVMPIWTGMSTRCDTAADHVCLLGIGQTVGALIAGWGWFAALSVPPEAALTTLPSCRNAPAALVAKTHIATHPVQQLPRRCQR
jgi:hypothetical protein